jgi:hypothetical protein
VRTEVCLPTSIEHRQENQKALFATVFVDQNNLKIVAVSGKRVTEIAECLRGNA